MSVIFVLIPLSIVTAAVFLGGFIWAVSSGQYEDTCTPAMRLLSEDAQTTNQKEESSAGKDGKREENQLLKSEGQ
jgi:cbb3-type cytochrome oxidase maturation protein